MEDEIRQALEFRRKHATSNQLHAVEEIMDHQAAAIAANQAAGERAVALAAQVQADPEQYFAEVRRAHERLVAVRGAHAPEPHGGHQHCTPGTQCEVCVGILQVGAALSSPSVTDCEAVHSRLDEVEAADRALRGV